MTENPNGPRQCRTCNHYSAFHYSRDSGMQHCTRQGCKCKRMKY